MMNCRDVNQLFLKFVDGSMRGDKQFRYSHDPPAFHFKAAVNSERFVLLSMERCGILFSGESEKEINRVESVHIDAAESHLPEKPSIFIVGEKGVVIRRSWP